MSGSTARGGPRRRWRLAAAAGVAVLVIALLAFLLLRDGDDDGAGDGAAAGTSSAAPSTSRAPTTSTPTEAAPTPEAPSEAPQAPSGDQLPPSQAPVPLDQPAEGGTGIRAVLTSVEAIDGQGIGPGAINGPALRVTVRLTNGSSEPLSLDGVQVTMALGEERAPASPLNDDSQAPFAGSLAPGASGDGRYVFTVPQDRRDLVTVTVGYRAGAPFLVFSGPVS